MAQRVEAFGKILEFPDDMPHDAMAKAIRDNEHLLNPDYKPPEPEALDYAKVFAAGANRLVSGAGYLMEKAGAKSTGKAVRAFGDRGADYWNKTMSPGGKAASESQVFVDDEDSMLGVRLSDEWGKALMMGAAQSAPTMFAAAIPGALAAKGIQALARLGLAGGSGATIPLLAGTAAPVGVTSNIIARAPAAIGFGAAEGLTAGSMNAAALKTSMEEMPESEREKSPVYNALASIHGKDKAWELITDQATSDLFGKTAVSTGTIGALTGGGALGQAYQKAAGATKGGILKQSGKGVVSEFIQETPQSGAEKYIENIVKKEYLDPSIDPMDGVVSGALSGGAIGAFSGGIVGGAGAINVTKSREERILEEKRKLAKQKADAANKQKTQKDVGDIMGAGSVDEAINAASNSASQNPIHQDDVLRTEDPTLADIERLTGLKPTEAIDQAINEARNNVAESVPGSNSAPNYDISRKLNPRDTDIVLPDGTTLKAQWDVVDADSISASIKEGVNQPRDRTRAASDIQIQGIANNPDYRRLSDSPVMDVGAPVLSNDGLIVGGNGRFEGIAQAHSQGTVNDYLRTLKEDVINKGIDPSIVDTMKKPVLVRRITQPFDTRALAIASNSGTSLQYSGLELAKIDSERMKGIEDLDITDTGDIALTGENFQKLRQSLSDYNPSELAALTDNSGMLSQDGVRRIRNAMLAKAYGKSETLGRLVESTDSDMRNVLGALTKSSGSVAKARAHINAGGAPKQIDVTDNLLQAVETFGKIRAVNQPLDNYLAQQNIFNDGIDADSKEILQFLHNNVRSQKRLTEFIKSVYDQISTIDQKTDNLFGDNAPPTKRELIENAKQRAAGNTAERADNESGRPNEPKSGTQKDYAGSGQKSEPDTGGANFSRSPEERLKDRERSRQLEKALNRTYKFTITPRDVRLGATANGRGEEAATAERIAKIFRKRVTWIDAEGDFPINGVMVPGISDTIFIDTRTNKYAHAVIGHELSHHLEQDNPKAYRDMVIALMPIIKDAEAYRKKKDLDELSEATLIKEIVGDIMGDNFTDQKFWNKVAEHNPNAFRKIADSIITWLKRLVTNAKIRGLGSEQWVTDVEKAQDIVAKAVAQYTHAEPSEEGSKSEAKLSKRNTFEKAQGSLFEDNSNLVSQEELLRENYARSGDLFSDTEDSPDKDPGKQGGKIDDFGEKLGRARKDMATAMRKEYSDDDIAALPLSKIWPASEVDAIEDKYVAATAFAAREEIPVKPRVSYKVASWVQKVKSLRMLASFVLDGKITKENFKKRLKEFSYSLNQFAAKVDLLERIDRSDWKRIGAVAEYPDAYRYDSSGTKIPSPFVSVDIDGRYKQFHGGDGTIPSVIDEINALLSERQAEADQTKRMQFEVRGREGNLFINKKGDREYRKLKTFTSTKEAFNYIKDNYDELVEAWEAVKESDNVKKTDVRRDENRPRTGKDWREGKDVTPEQFDDEFGFKGVEFGNWVSQGGDNKERQGMLNQAYDALMDLSNIVGIPPKAISLNGSLGLGFGSRGKGWASAHFEPDMLVINLTKTRGAGSLAHEWFHAMDNYFQRQRGTPSGADRKDYFVTYRPEPMMVHVSGRSYPMTREQLIKRRSQGIGGEFYKAENWIPDAKHPQGVRPEVERKFSDLVHVLDESPMKKRAEIIDKGEDDGYWSRIIERAARSFENYVIAKMMREGYQNDYLANVVSPEDFSRDKGRYPYLLESEIAPVEKAFDDLFGEIKYKQTDKGVALFSRAEKPQDKLYSKLQRAIEDAPDKVFSTGAQTKLWLQSNATKLGVKKDEIYWSGIENWLDAQDKVSKQQVVEFVAQNGVKVEEATLGGDKEFNSIRDRLDRMLLDELEDKPVDKKEQALLEERLREIKNTEPKHNNDKLTLPGGTNYKEIVLTVPTIEPYNADDTTHFGDTGGGRQIGWLRVDTRNNGLFIQELQSQRAQQGRSRGFNDRPPGKQFFVTHDLFYNIVNEYGDIVTKEDTYDIAAKRAKDFNENGLPSYLQYNNVAKGVPPAPFVSDANNKATNAYITLLMKKAVIEAVENNADFVAWTTGDQQADRYDLSKQVDTISYLFNKDRTTVTIQATKDNKFIYAKNNLPVGELADNFGKDIAKKIVDDEGETNFRTGYKELSGLDLKTGGEWAQSMYGDINGLDKTLKPSLISQAAKDVFKHIGGGKVEAIEIKGIGKQPGFYLTDEMKNKVVTDGMPLFSRVQKIPETINIDGVYRSLRNSNRKLIEENDVPIQKPIIPKVLSQKQFEIIIQEFDNPYLREDSFSQNELNKQIDKIKSGGAEFMDFYHVTDLNDYDIGDSGLTGNKSSVTGRNGFIERDAAVYGFLDPDDINKGYRGVLGANSDKPNVFHIKVPLNELKNLEWDSNFNVTFGTYSGVAFYGNIPINWVGGIYKNVDLRSLVAETAIKMPITSELLSDSDDIRFSKVDSIDIPWDDTSIFKPVYTFQDGTKATEEDYNKFVEYFKYQDEKQFEGLFGRLPEEKEVPFAPVVHKEIPAASMPFPEPSKLMTQENVDNISRAILAVKEGLIGVQSFNLIVDKNLPLPPENERGLNMMGDVYAGSLRDNLNAHFGQYLSGLGIPHRDIMTGEILRRPKVDINDYDFSIEYPGTKIEQYRARRKGDAGKYYSQSIFAESLEDAKRKFSQRNNGEVVSIADGENESSYAVGSGQFDRQPELYDRMATEFRKNPAKLLRSVLEDIKGRLEEQDADMFFFKEAIKDAERRNYDESPEGRRSKFKLKKGGLHDDGGEDVVKFSLANDSTQTADPAADEGISPDRTKESDIPGETRFRKFQREWQDDFNRFTVLKEWLASRGINLSEKADVYLAEERFHARVANQQEDFRDFVANPLIQKIAEAGYKMTDIADFLEAQHAKEANDQIRRVHNTNDPDVTAYGVGDEEAAEYLANAPEELGKLANEFRAITESTKRIRLEGGLLNTDITGAWDATYKHYIPVKGIQDQPKGTGKRLSVNFKTKRRLGHGRRDEAVIENILHDHARAIFEVEKNRVAKHLVMMAAEIGMPELMTVGQPVKRKVLRNTTAYEVQVKGATVAVFDSREAAQTYKSSLPLIDKKVASDEIVINPTTDQRVIASASPMLADNEINAYIDGHAIRIQINDELAARAYKKLGVDGYGKLVAAGRALNGYLSKVYTGYNPEFIQVNIVRDFTTGIINLTGEEGLKMAAKAIKNYPGTFASLLRYSVSDRKKSTKWIDMYRATGGNTGAAYLSDMERLGNDVATEYAAYQGVLANLKEGKPVFAARAAGRKAFNIFLKWIYNMNQAGENAMRLAAFKAMIESGRTPNEAAHVAKNITVNFNRKGENGATANAAWLFFNASVQGQAAMSHALFKGKHKGQAWALATGMATLGYMVAAALGGGDEDDYDKIDDYTKERNLVINNGDGWLKIPIPYGYGFFYNIGRAMADAQRKDELGLVPWHITASAIEELSPFGDIVVGSDEQFKMDQAFMGILPTALKIPGQVAVNKQLFSGGEIMPDNPFDKSQPEREKMWRGTKGTVYDELAGRLQQIGLDVSPETLKYSFRTGTGGAGALVDSTVSAGMLKAGGAELDTAEIPFLRKIYHENTIKNDRAAFHKAREEAQTAAEEFARAIRKNDLVSAKKLSEDKGELIALDKYADQLQTVTKLWRDEQDRVRTDKSLTTGEKRLKLRELEAQESKLYDQYLDVFKVKKAEVKKKVDN